MTREPATSLSRQAMENGSSPNNVCISNPMPHRLPEGENATPLEVIGTTASDKLVIIMVGLPATGTYLVTFCSDLCVAGSSSDKSNLTIHISTCFCLTPQARHTLPSAFAAFSRFFTTFRAKFLTSAIIVVNCVVRNCRPTFTSRNTMQHCVLIPSIDPIGSAN